MIDATRVQKLLVISPMKNNWKLLHPCDVTPYSVSLRIQSKCRENADQNNYEYGHYIRSDHDNG